MKANEFQQIFPLGEKNDAYAQYFIGQSYLSMLTTEQIGMVLHRIAGFPIWQ